MSSSTSTTTYCKPPVPGVVASIINANNCKDHIQWIKTVFQAEQYEIYMSDDDKKILHCVLCLNEGYLYISDPMEGASTDKPAGFMLSVDMLDPSDTWSRATSNEAIVVMELAVQSCGDMLGIFRDPFGFVWGVKATTDNRKPGVVPCILRDGDCHEHIQWIETALNGVVKTKIVKDGRIQHSTVEVNGSTVYVAEGSASPAMKQLCTSGKVPSLMCHLDLPDPFPLWDQLLKNGATSTITLEKQFWGGTYGAVRDTMGVEWSLSKAMNVEDQPNATGVTPYIRSTDCDQHIDWVQKVFAGEVKELFRTKERKIMHCRVGFNGGHLYLSDRMCSPSSGVQENSEGVTLHVVLSDPDMVWKKALRNNAEVIMELEQQFWGGYYGCFRDPLGVRWGILKKCQQ